MAIQPVAGGLWRRDSGSPEMNNPALTDAA